MFNLQGVRGKDNREPKQRGQIEKNKITHIINCAADFCENVFESENKYTYCSFYLKDHVLENIECIFYECIKFIENVKEKGGRVLVHCIQGISTPTKTKRPSGKGAGARMGEGIGAAHQGL